MKTGRKKSGVVKRSEEWKKACSKHVRRKRLPGPKARKKLGKKAREAARGENWQRQRTMTEWNDVKTKAAVIKRATVGEGIDGG